MKIDKNLIGQLILRKGFPNLEDRLILVSDVTIISRDQASYIHYDSYYRVENGAVVHDRCNFRVSKEEGCYFIKPDYKYILTLIEKNKDDILMISDLIKHAEPILYSLISKLTCEIAFNYLSTFDTQIKTQDNV